PRPSLIGLHAVSRSRSPDVGRRSSSMVQRFARMAVGVLSVVLASPSFTLAGTSAAKPFKSKQTYSPAAGWNYPRRVYWGDTHLHTSASFDAGAFGNRLGFEDAY